MEWNEKVSSNYVLLGRSRRNYLYVHKKIFFLNLYLKNGHIKLYKKSHMIISIEAVKGLGKIQYPLEILRKLGVEGTPSS